MKLRSAQVKRSGARNRWSCCLAVALTLLVGGCATVSSPPACVTHPSPPSEEVRAAFGPIIIVGAEARPTEIARPPDKGHAAGDGALAGLVLAPQAGGALGGGYGFAMGLFLSPLTAVGGAIYGASAGMSEGEFEQLVGTLRTVALECDVPGRLESGCREATQRLAPWALAPSNAPVGGTSTRLELVTLFALKAQEGIDPPLTLNCTVQVRVLSGSHGAELFVGQFECLGAAHTLRKWAADNGAEFRNGIATACNALVEQIAERVFLVHAFPGSFTESRSLPWVTK